MLKKGLLLICALLLFSACGFFKKDKPPPPPAPPEPTRVVLKLETTADINPNSEGRPSPLALRIYQLKAYSVFGSANFFSLYDRDEQVLGSELVSKEEFLLKPNEKRTVFYETEDNTRAIGLLGIFMDYERTQWKAITGVVPNKTSVVTIYISKAGISIR